jgi:hypothetical protein
VVSGFWYPGSRDQTPPKSSDISGEKIFSAPSFGGEVKPSFPCRSFAACKKLTWKPNCRLNSIGNFSPFHCQRSFATSVRGARLAGTSGRVVQSAYRLQCLRRGGTRRLYSKIGRRRKRRIRTGHVSTRVQHEGDAEVGLLYSGSHKVC